jgi:hypothetical protein
MDWFIGLEGTGWHRIGSHVNGGEWRGVEKTAMEWIGFGALGKIAREQI